MRAILAQAVRQQEATTPACGRGVFMQRGRYVVPFSQLRMTDVESVGGKNASLGEMLSQLADQGIRVPDGFATTAEAFRTFLSRNDLTARINGRLGALDVEDVKALAAAGEEIRAWVVASPLPEDLQAEIRTAFGALARASDNAASFAVRS